VYSFLFITNIALLDEIFKKVLELLLVAALQAGSFAKIAHYPLLYLAPP
jgi:hypothetical protein